MGLWTETLSPFWPWQEAEHRSSDGQSLCLLGTSLSSQLTSVYQVILADFSQPEITSVQFHVWSPELDPWERMGGCTDQSLASVLVPPLHCSDLMGFTPAGYIFQISLLAGLPLVSVS